MDATDDIQEKIQKCKSKIQLVKDQLENTNKEIEYWKNQENYHIGIRLANEQYFLEDLTLYYIKSINDIFKRNEDLNSKALEMELHNHYMRQNKEIIELENRIMEPKVIENENAFNIIK